jgi:hypothetical protein
VDGLGELAGAPGAAAELAQDAPGLELGVRALAGWAQPGVRRNGLFLGLRLVLPLVRDVGVRAALVALISQGDQPGARVWAEDPGTGKRRNLTLEDHQAFWAWATVEVLRMTGIRVEELTELSHHSLIQYKLPATGELIPLLHIAPSKTDAERLLVAGPELAEVLSAIICRIRDKDGTVPLVVAYDMHELVWLPPMPLLFQRRYGAENRPIPAHAIRKILHAALAAAGLTSASGTPLTFTPHPFRRLWITEAVMHGMPPHIAQLICGHQTVTATMGYKAVRRQRTSTGGARQVRQGKSGGRPHRALACRRIER